jgi:serine phosphatase RsbU (regulator of sigma subunit)
MCFPALKVFFTSILCLLVLGNSKAQDSIGSTPTDYKFATLYTWKIIENLDWPEDYEQGEFQIYVLGNSPIHKYFKTWEKNRHVNKRRVRVRRIGKITGLRKTHIIYVPQYLDKHIEAIVWHFKDLPTLILTETKGLIRKGAHVDFIKVHDRIRFEIGSGNIEKIRIGISKDILKLASREIRKESVIEKPKKSKATFIVKLEAEQKISKSEEEDYNNFMDELALLASSTRKKVRIDTEDLQALLDMQKEQEAEMQKNQEKMKKQRRSINALVRDTKKRKTQLEEQNQVYEEKHKELQALQKKEKRINEVLVRKEKILQGKELTIREQVGEIQGHKYTIYIMAIFLLVAIILGYFIYRNYQAKVRANAIIEEQKALVEEKNQKITDSITYAKRLQSAILPSDKIVKNYLDQSFIYYQPKDIVAGDFYWMDQFHGKIIFAAADCTGHGVPGAFVSIVCHNALNRSVREFGMKSPGEILDKTRELVVGQFDKNDESVKDGMDIGLCAYDVKKKKLEFAGANNRLFLVKKDKKEPVLEDLKGDKQPVGQFDNPKPFTNHVINLKKGDCIYLSTDGFPDQFGGPKGKKYMYKRFQELLISLYEHPMEKQKNFIKANFESWRGEEEQLDDVCVLGMRA